MAAYEEDVAPEPNPSADQRRRLDDWCTELLIICRRYRIHMDDSSGDVRIIDTDRDTLIGLGLFAVTTEKGEIGAYMPVDSILDGVWLVDTADGPVEQRDVTNMLPERDEEPPA